MKIENWNWIRDSSDVFWVRSQIFFCMRRMTMNLISFESPHPGGPFKYPSCMYITPRKFFRAIWRKKIHKNAQNGWVFHIKKQRIFHGFQRIFCIIRGRNFFSVLTFLAYECYRSKALNQERLLHTLIVTLQPLKMFLMDRSHFLWLFKLKASNSLTFGFLRIFDGIFNLRGKLLRSHFFSVLTFLSYGCYHSKALNH